MARYIINSIFRINQTFYYYYSANAIHDPSNGISFVKASAAVNTQFLSSTLLQFMIRSLVMKSLPENQ